MDGGIVWLIPILWIAHIYFYFTLEPPYRSTVFAWGSVILEIAGGIIVFWQINKKNIKFKGKNIIEGFFDYFERIPSWSKSKSIHIEGHPTKITTTSKRATVTVGNQFLEQNVKFLMDEVKRLDGKINEFSKKQNQENNNSKKLLTDLNQETRETRDNLKDAITGDIKLQIFGALIFFEGVIMGAMS